MPETTLTTLHIPATIDPVAITGPSDEFLRIIEDSFDARITVRGDAISIEGDPVEVSSLTTLFDDLMERARMGEPADAQQLRRALEMLRTDEFSPRHLRDDVVLAFKGRAIRPKTAGQKRYVDAIRAHTITFGLGPAGTGKTYLAMAMALLALERGEQSRLVLSRPIVEAGENLGFLPGTLTEKVDPYIRPLYDALFDMMEPERATSLLEAGVIEIAPLAFMRGRTLNDSFVILDEAQNATPEQMKMFLTRLGFGSKMIITGDGSQTDLPRGATGLEQACAVLDGIDDIAFCRFSGKDVIRHRLVAAIVAAYDRAGGVL